MATIKSIEQKAKAYDEALKVLHKYDGANIMFTQDLKEEMFPELKESEDEKIRKELIEHIKDEQSSFISAPDCRDRYEEEENDKYNSWIAWLEKQGEQKTSPIFEVGDVMRTKEEATKGLKSGMPVVVSIDKEYYHCNNELIAIKDQYDYEYPPMNRIQKPAWSEVDEKNFNWFEKFFRAESVVAEGKDIPQDRYLWFKNLKDRVQPKPKQEWSEKDETALGDALWCCKQAASIAKDENDMGNVWYAETWLKSLRPQNRWKPSDEQMHYLSWIANVKLGDSIVEQEVSKHLNELLEDLKKLMEG